MTTTGLSSFLSPTLFRNTVLSLLAIIYYKSFSIQAYVNKGYL